LLILALSILPNACPGQPDSVITKSYIPEIKILYNSSLIYPGLSAGAGFIIKEKEIFIKKRKLPPGSVIIIRKQLITAILNWYHHSGFHDNLYLTFEWVMRKMKKGGFYSEFSAGPGFSRTFLGGTTYRIADDGSVTIKKHAGYNYAMVRIGGGEGYDFSRVKGIPLSAFAKMNLFTMFPYNSTVYIRPVLELGVRLKADLFSEIKRERGTNITIN